MDGSRLVPGTRVDFLAEGEKQTGTVVRQGRIVFRPKMGGSGQLSNRPLNGHGVCLGEYGGLEVYLLSNPWHVIIRVEDSEGPIFLQGSIDLDGTVRSLGPIIIPQTTKSR